MHRFIQNASLTLIALFLVGCAATTEPRKYSDITFMHKAPIKLDVARIRYEPRYKPSLATPQVGHNFPTPPVTAMENWIRDRLRAVGRSGEARITIREASATEQKLKTEGGVKGVFKTDQAWRYDVSVEMIVSAVDPNRRLKGEASARATRKRTVPEDINLNDREAVWFDIMEQTMKTFDDTLEAQIRKNLSAFIRP
jgi:hypothetical protein